jgi:hypothetical protein
MDADVFICVHLSPSAVTLGSVMAKLGASGLIIAKRVEIHSVGITTIHTFEATKSMILGNIVDKLDLGECEAWREEFRTRSTVWGYKLLADLVNKVPNNGAAPNGGPATRLGNSGVAEGPPSVS